ncbi:TonB-dependent receptor plug domain-containing protein [Pseudoduganella albidiflava]|nr:TonB-dependent receptor [Pseudoduganella albidiflava]GGY40858.1 TonB-dependent receptor [Pseudoduganella albidiflava]
MHHSHHPVPRRLALSAIALAVAALAGQAAAQEAVQEAAQATQESAQATQQATGATAAQQAAPVATGEVIKVEVTGSTIKRVAGEMALPVSSVKADDIASAALTTVADLAVSLPSSATNAPSSAGAGTNMNMRGIGINRTLVLLNGRRMVNEPLSNGFVNVDLIPISALNRVEVLRDGASSTYGTDAMGGVVNFLTRRSYKGLELTGQVVRPEASGGGREHRVSVLGGIGDLAADGWNVYATVDVHKRSKLESADRPELTNPALLASLGIAPKAASGTYAWPANVFSPSTGITGNPYYASGCLPPYSVPATRNTCIQDANYVLALPANAQAHFFAKGSIKLPGDHLVTAELLHAKEHIETQKPPTTTVGFNGAVARITPDSPYYPGGSAGVPAMAGINGSPLNVSWSVAELGPAIAKDEQKITRVVVTGEGTIGQWDYRLGGIYGRGKRDSYFVQGYLNGARLQAGVANGVLNPFGTQSAAGLEYLKSISADGGQIRHTTNRYYGTDLTLTRELMQLGGGAMTLALGAEYHRDANDDRALDGVIDVPYQNRLPSYAEGSRDISAVFAELDLPVTADLSFNVAARHDRYSDFGGTSNPKASFRWQPMKQLMFRGSASTGFRAPTLFDRYGYRLPGATSLSTSKWDDPVLCPGTMGMAGTGTAVPGANPLLVCNTALPIQQGSNPEVQPETSRNLTLGVVIEPVRNLMVMLDYYDIHVKDSIGQLAQNAIFTNTAKYADLFVRNPDGSLAYVRNTVDNLGDLRTAGIDVGLSYAFPKASYGQFKAALDGTYVTRFENQTEKDGPWISNLGRFGSVGSGNVSASPTYTFRWKHTLRLSWERGDWFSQLTQFYNTGYHDLNNVPAQFHRDIEPYSVWNMTVNYKGIKHVKVSLGISNLFDENPPVTNSNSTAYANNIASPIGRAYNARLTYEF